jgi:hypothetical protein
MAHYAYLDKNNIVAEVIVGRNEGDDNTDWEQYYGNRKGQTCKRTSFNTFGNIHNQGGTPFRKNFALEDYKYNSVIDGFVPPKPFDSWVLNTTTGLWDAPTDRNDDEFHYLYASMWNEEDQIWVD